MIAQFERQSIRFSYPESWQVEEQDLGDGWAVTLTNPTGAFWTLSAHPRSIAAEDAIEALVAGLSEAYPGLEVSSVDPSSDEQLLAGKELHFICLDLTNTAQIRAFHTAEATVSIIWQAEDHEYDHFAEVVSAVNASLVAATAVE